MNALGSTAFHPELTPMALMQAAAQLEPTQPEDAAEMQEFAADFAAIQNLPEQELGSTLNRTIEDYS